MQLRTIFFTCLLLMLAAPASAEIDMTYQDFCERYGEKVGSTDVLVAIGHSGPQGSGYATEPGWFTVWDCFGSYSCHVSLYGMPGGSFYANRVEAGGNYGMQTLAYAGGSCTPASATAGDLTAATWTLEVSGMTHQGSSLSAVAVATL